MSSSLRRSFAFEAVERTRIVDSEATNLAHNVAYDCFCVNNDSISLALTDERMGRRADGRADRRKARIVMEWEFPCLWQFFATFLFLLAKSFLISNKSKGLITRRDASR